MIGMEIETMARFKFYVTETRNYEMLYEVEADTIREAIMKAEKGETESEEELSFTGVNDRFVSEEA